MKLIKFIIFLEMLGYLPAVMLTFFALWSSNTSIHISTNVVLVLPALFGPAVLMLGWVRWKIFCAKLKGSSPKSIQKAFMKGNFLALLGLPVFMLLSFPVEGNILGWVLFPLMLVAFFVQAPVIWIMLRLQIKRLKSEPSQTDHE